MRSKVAAEATLERVLALVEALPDAVVVTNAQRHIETVNTQTERCLGYTRERAGRHVARSRARRPGPRPPQGWTREFTWS